MTGLPTHAHRSPAGGLPHPVDRAGWQPDPDITAALAAARSVGPVSRDILRRLRDGLAELDTDPPRDRRPANRS